MQIRVKAAKFVIAIAILSLSTAIYADGAKAEIEYLLSAVGSSDCLFVRNGKDHPAEEGADHLRMKYNKGARRIKSAEMFINRVASESSWTSKPYLVRCPGEAEQPSAIWLTTLLAEHRAANDAKP